MDQLRLIALDEQDLNVISAHVQDAVMKVRDLQYLPDERRFVLAMNRFAWERKSGFLRKKNERRQSVLHFDRVLGAKAAGIARDKPDEVLSLLAVSFVATDKPAGIVELVFSGGGAIMLDVECVEARLADTGGVWQASSRPAHRI
ncbi:DUF2948 family protein [Aquamicrobium ahrensii]|uniref:DUF2948 family protein n=1 Tax=Aquamicrobium ahrensii TaxID=469551 RepID=A0ABV2KPZ5_9HYPH